MIQIFGIKPTFTGIFAFDKHLFVIHYLTPCRLSYNKIVSILFCH
ncbi:hypothetical protein ECDEC6B_5593 [Escherichia coli DEC6B]|nr:hypothetical protein ECDEC6B_5593 [Escherichia coli DEC6B]